MAFDFRVDHYNKQGQVIRHDPYRMVIDKDGKRMERPPHSGKWYAEDGKLVKDESTAIEAVKAKAELEQKQLSEQKLTEAREKLKAELRAEILAEEAKKAGKVGPSSKN